jgi:hypothetical protein
MDLRVRAAAHERFLSLILERAGRARSRTSLAARYERAGEQAD